MTALAALVAFLAGIATTVIPTYRAIKGRELVAEMAWERAEAAEPAIRTRDTVVRMLRDNIARARRQRESGVVILPTVHADPDVLPPSAAIQPPRPQR